ncbi:MAG: hypothetical protein J7639_21510 [Paenibacillaceae bacterium]|nr:hypothetical protein [Paenibacillaceae bacterium]
MKRTIHSVYLRWPVWIGLILIAMSLAACGAGSGPGGEGPVAGDSLYVPDGYRAKLEAAGLREIAAFPYFTAPFIAVVQDAGGREQAALFDRAGAMRTVPLPVTYEKTVQAIQKRGIPVPTPPASPQPTAEFRNLHLFEIGSALYWCYDDGTTRLYLDLNGRETDPFAKTAV